ncbi:hypothetical protein Tco_0597759 [Tanacetum coccineum]
MASDSSDQDTRYALSKLLQMGTVVEYESEFVVHANRVTGISESLLTSPDHRSPFEEERATIVIAKPNDLNIAVQVQDIEKTTLHTSDKVEAVSTNLLLGKKVDLGAITSKGGPPDYMRASEKELVVLKSPLEQKSMFRRQEQIFRRQEQQRLAKDAKIQRRIWDPRIKSIQDNTLRAM